MKFKLYLLLFLIYSTTSFAQISEHYYGTVAKSEATLDSKVTSTLDHISVGYSFSPANPTNTDCLIFKTDSAGSVLWTKEMATPNIDQLNTVIETFDGNYVAVGIINATGSYANNTAIAMKISPTGVIIWNKQFKATTPGETFLDVVEMPISHDIICIGSYSFSPSINSGLLISLNNISGATNWAKSYDISGSNQFSGGAADNNNIFVTGIYQGVSFDDGYLASIDASNGNIIWSKSYEYNSILQAGTNCNWFWKIQSANSKLYINGWITNDYLATASLTSNIIELDTLGNNPTCLEMLTPGTTYALNCSFSFSNNNFYAIQHPSNVYLSTSNLPDVVISKLSSLNTFSSSLIYSKKISNPGDQAVSSIYVLNNKLIGSGQSQNDPGQIGFLDCFHIISDTALFSLNACAINDTTLSLANPIVNVLPFNFSTIQPLTFSNPFITLSIISPSFINDTICSYVPTLSITATNDTICLGDFITLTANNGSNYVWSGGVIDGVPFSPLATSTYTVTSTTSTGITSTSSITVLVNPKPIVTATASPSVVCQGNSAILSGNGALTYTWSGGVVNGVSFIPPASGTYTVTGTSVDGCTSTATVSLIVNPKPLITAVASPDSVCPGKPTTLTANGGSSYSWTGGVTNGVPFIPSGTTTYTVTGTSANGCSNTSSVTVAVINIVNISIMPADPILCLGDSIQLSASGASTYNWSPNVSINAVNISDPLVYPNSTTTYFVTGTDAAGCTGSASIEIEVVAFPKLIVSKSMDVECHINTIQLSASGAVNYSWSPASFLSNANAAITSATIFTPTTFTVIGSVGSCVVLDSIFVDVFNNDEESIFIPNAFSPNGDGHNDCLRIKESAKFTDYYFAIYNRWGQKVFEASDPNDCWNGIYKNEKADIGSYYYYLKAETKCGKVFRKGDITLIK